MIISERPNPNIHADRADSLQNHNNPNQADEPVSGESTIVTETSVGQVDQHRHVIDLVSQEHGPLFLQLTSEEQGWLLTLHRNLGHPGHAKLREFVASYNALRNF